MALLSTEEINSIRNSIDIVDVISSYIPLTGKGKNYFGVCPFHDDHAPSMSVSREKQIYTCFSCGATGNVFNFLMDYENISFIEAVKLIASKSGIPINIEINKQPKKNNVLYDIYDLSKKFYQNNLNTELGKEAREYLHKRNFNDEIISFFEIGLSLNNKNSLSNFLLKKKFLDTDLINSGLSNERDKTIYDVFMYRIIFPLDDITGNTVAFSGRIYNRDDTSKYVNTKETEIFKKGEILYNYFKAKDECRLKKRVYVMEGFMDVIKSYSVGIKNCVATMGTAITKNHALLLKKLASDIILCFDGDKAGMRATKSAIEVLGEIGIYPKIIYFEDNLDPDEYINKFGRAAYQTKLENPISLIDFNMMYHKVDKDMSNSSDLSNYVKTLLKEVNLIDDDILREISLNKIAEETNLSLDFLKSKIDTKKEIPIKNKNNSIKLNKYQKATEYLLYYMLLDEEVIKIYQNRASYIPDDNYRFLASEINCFYKNNLYFDLADFMTSIANHRDIFVLIGKIQQLNYPKSFDYKDIEKCLKVIEEYNINYEYNRLKENMKKEIDPIKKAKIAKKMLDLKIKGE